MSLEDLLINKACCNVPHPSHLCPTCLAGFERNKLVTQQLKQNSRSSSNREVSPLPLPVINWNEPLDAFGNPIPEEPQPTNSSSAGRSNNVEPLPLPVINWNEPA